MPDYEIVNTNKYEIVNTIGVECYSPNDVMKMLKLSRAETYRLFNNQVEPFNSFKIGRSLRITKADFHNWLNAKYK